MRGNDDYFNWLLDQVNGEDVRYLCEVFDDIDFLWVIPLDSNRMYDGLKLREWYADETGNEVQDRNYHTCTFLEFLVALSIRIEKDIMYNVNYGDRSHFWFHELIKNVGFENTKVGYCISERDIRLASREVMERTKTLFPTRNPKKDWRRSHFWQQANIWLMENFPE